jgi:hypothetical protein
MGFANTVPPFGVAESAAKRRLCRVAALFVLEAVR